MKDSIDLATELAEGFALAPFGIPLKDIRSLVLSETGQCFHERHSIQRFDAEVSQYISSAHLSCGLHSGDPILMRRTAQTLLARGVRIGAHPSYPDGFGFGQSRIKMADDDLEAVLLYQLGGLSAVLAGVGGQIHHVKCHGLLQFDVSYEERFCAILVNAVMKFDPRLTLILMAESPGIAFARAKGLRVASEGYVDRAYSSTGRIISINQPGGLVSDPQIAVTRAIEMTCEQQVSCVDGTKIGFSVDSICLHADTPGAGAIAAAVADALTSRGVAIAAI